MKIFLKLLAISSQQSATKMNEGIIRLISSIVILNDLEKNCRGWVNQSHFRAWFGDQTPTIKYYNLKLGLLYIFNQRVVLD